MARIDSDAMSRMSEMSSEKMKIKEKSATVESTNDSPQVLTCSVLLVGVVFLLLVVLLLIILRLF